ncbi:MULTISPECIES: flavin reductase family protein [unclassified Streptomyces]|uniref:flavin reductase family protein n=1 Tax=unclassified Streptomyces TaxID=2593676 RepID=UPI001BE80E24|nr:MULTISPECIES: flavin reductase family protein [unclassified Streptomyces]MBT2405486.1 flavin reductase family protein [Streptomyces sp. ISL-21]MBT2454404.1 flavin reductase family protein [Streptomyces sp. ISL-86]MBT2607835.1 flavin reductase family protein [Streptomyces sp. ISL-87]
MTTQPAVTTATEATPDAFRSLMSEFPTGVCAVTTIDVDGEPWGMTCSSVASVALTPPTLLVNLRAGSPTLQALLNSGSFTLNFLHDEARETAELFASGNPDRFALVPWERPPGVGGPHLVRDAHTVADCEVVLTQPMGDHVTVYGEARRITRLHARPPLLYGQRQFRSWSQT